MSELKQNEINKYVTLSTAVSNPDSGQRIRASAIPDWYARLHASGLPHANSDRTWWHKSLKQSLEHRNQIRIISLPASRQ